MTDAIGLGGSLLLGAAYFLVSRRWLDPQGRRYSLMNLGGAGLVLVWLYLRSDAGGITVQVIWAAIALLALARVLRPGS